MPNKTYCVQVTNNYGVQTDRSVLCDRDAVDRLSAVRVAVVAVKHVDRDVTLTGQLRVSAVRHDHAQHVNVVRLAIDVGVRVDGATRVDEEEAPGAADDVDKAELERRVDSDVSVGGGQRADLHEVYHELIILSKYFYVSSQWTIIHTNGDTVNQICISFNL